MVRRAPLYEDMDLGAKSVVGSWAVLRGIQRCGDGGHGCAQHGRQTHQRAEAGQPVTGFEVPVAFEGPVDTAIDADTADHLLFTVREALSNVARHAAAARASVTVSVQSDRVVLRVVDDGRGMGPAREGGLGLQNMRRRAEKLSGELVLEAGPGGRGTALLWSVRLGT